MAKNTKKIGYKGAALPDTVREGILQSVAMGNTKKMTAEMFGVDITTVYRVLKKVDPEIQKERRREALAKIAGDVSVKVQQHLETLEPDGDATYMQRATVTGILTDKLVALDKRISDNEKDEMISEGTMVPESIEALVGVIKNDLREVSTIVGIKFGNAGSGEEAQLKKLEEELAARMVEIDQDEVRKMDDMYDVGGSDGDSKG
jgi:hypothetical protein